jgi:GNAT superfamily N-acetyltransferase
VARPPVADVTLPDGGVVRIRMAAEGDDAELVVGFEELSEESRYYRFFSPMPRLTGRLLEELSRFDLEGHIAIPAFDPAKPSETGNPDGMGIGVVRVIRDEHDWATAEFAVTVIDEYQGRGVGRALMQAAIVVAATLGVTKLTASVLSGNRRMLELASSLRFQPTPVQEEYDVRSVAVAIEDALAAIPPERRSLFETLVVEPA